MNILPHKSWHVRTKKNIARVRKDEAKAAAEEKETQRRISLAAQEARTSFLRERAVSRISSQISAGGGLLDRDVGDDGQQEDEGGGGGGQLPPPQDDDKCPIPLARVTDLNEKGHINFFEEIEQGKKQNYEVNKEHEEEKKKEQEDYEKKIGYLVYLGGEKGEIPWYAQIGNRKDEPSTSAQLPQPELTPQKSKDDEAMKSLKLQKIKDFNDPLQDIRKLLKTPGVKKIAQKEQKKINFVSSSSSSAQVPSKPLQIKEEGGTRKRKGSSELETKHKHHKKKTKKSKRSKSNDSKKAHKHKSKKKHTKKESFNSGEDSESVSDEEYQLELEKKKKLEKLRADRLEREREERRKAEKVLAKLRGEDPDKPKEKVMQDEDGNDLEGIESRSSGGHDGSTRRPQPFRKQKYNSQFNPHLARQNFDD